MVLYLFRHGIAGPAERGQRDAQRTLTPEGVDQLRRQARALQRAGVRVDWLVSSTLLRARQTAALLAPAVGATPEADALLKPSCRLGDVAELLARRPEAARVMLVSHQPALGHLIHTLTGSNASVRTGTMAVIELHAVRPAGGYLVGLYDPDLMARLE